MVVLNFVVASFALSLHIYSLQWVYLFALSFCLLGAYMIDDGKLRVFFPLC